MKMKLLSREDLLKKEELKKEKVVLRADSYVYVREMRASERDRWEQSMISIKYNPDGSVKSQEQNLQNFRAKLAEVTMCDEEGNLILQPGDFKVLAESLGAVTMEKIINAAQKLNKITNQDKEELTKN